LGSFVFPQVEVIARRERSATWQRMLRALPRFQRHAQVLTFVALAIATVVCAWAVDMWDGAFPRTSLIPIAVLGGLFLAPTWLFGLDVFIIAAFVATTFDNGSLQPQLLGPLVVLVIVMMMMFWLAESRARLGVQGTLGESMLVDLRDRLRTQGELPALPAGWHAEISVRSAYGASFSGDFVVTSKSIDGRRLELVLVDVSGKGVGAGSRSLLLSGAFGGLLGSMEAERFLPAANSFLMRQRWTEGFATAAHLIVDLETGAFSVGSAGHPPPVKFAAGSGRWEVLEGDNGPLLGVLEGIEFPRREGVLNRGDALLLYTDGVIETRNRDLNDGIDRMLGTAERMLSKGFNGIAARITTLAAGGESDDRAAVMVWRTAG
jgi:hypothetical protein